MNLVTAFLKMLSKCFPGFTIFFEKLTWTGICFSFMPSSCILYSCMWYRVLRTPRKSRICRMFILFYTKESWRWFWLNDHMQEMFWGFTSVCYKCYRAFIFSVSYVLLSYLLLGP